MQNKQNEWHDQWSLVQDGELGLFKDWIAPFKLEDFRGKTVLEAGCGGGQHTSFVAPYASEIVAVDLNTVDIAKKRNEKFKNITYVEADIAAMDLGRKFDIVFSIGVVHHTDSPDKTFENLRKHVKPGGTLIVWVYSQEGNAMVQYGVEPVRKLLLSRMSRRALLGLSKVVTAMMYPPIYTIYPLPLRFLPYYEYFQNFRQLSYERNVLNVFDKLNAPQVDLISRERIGRWFSHPSFAKSVISPYRGVSWTGVGTLTS